MPIATRPRVYSLYKLDDSVREHAEKHFDLICPGEQGHEHWRTQAEGVMMRSEAITSEDVKQIGDKLKYVSKHGVGVDRLDIKGLRARGITVTNTPGVNASAVAELALALMMAVARNIVSIDRRIRAGETVPKAEGGSGLQLGGRTLGLIGGGNIAQQVGRMFYGAFQGSIIVYDPYLSPSAKAIWTSMIPQDKLTIVDKDNLAGLLSESDVVSIHVPLLDSTRDLIAAKELAIMKPSAILVNSARGGIVNEEDLAEALEKGSILGAGIDAYEIEPPTLQSAGRLINHSRVVST